MLCLGQGQGSVKPGGDATYMLEVTRSRGELSAGDSSPGQRASRQEQTPALLGMEMHPTVVTGAA